MFKDGDEYSRQRHKEALRNYHRVVAQQITMPMLRQSEQATDPLERTLQIQFAQLNALFLDKAPAVRELALGEIGPSDKAVKNTTENAVTQWLAISNQLVTLAKELMKWKPRKSKPVVKRVQGSNLDLSRRFADSDLHAKN
jgi:hypothetical protein